MNNTYISIKYCCTYQNIFGKYKYFLFSSNRVMRCIVRRYVTSEQRKSENTNITEDDINEVIQMHTPYVYLHWYLVSRLQVL